MHMLLAAELEFEGHDYETPKFAFRTTVPHSFISIYLPVILLELHTKVITKIFRRIITYFISKLNWHHMLYIQYRQCLTYERAP